MQNSVPPPDRSTGRRMRIILRLKCFIISILAANMLQSCLSILIVGAAAIQVAATCSGGKEWQQCATACPLTCDNYDRDAAPVNCTESCIEGCACPEGKVELDGVCVEPSTCASCGECEEGQQCSAVIADNGVRVVCDPIAVPCSPDVPLTCPTNARCLTHNTTGTSFCLESCFMQNGGCSSDQECHTDTTCNPHFKSCYSVTCHDKQEGCPVGKVFNECGSLCQRTCEEYLTSSHKDCSDVECGFPACVCPEGLVEYKDRCVHPLECHSLLYNALVGWEKTAYYVDEDTAVNHTEVCAFVYTVENDECPIPLPFELEMEILGPNEDYESVNTRLKFAPCQKRQCYNVTIFDDELLEGNESFLVTLERTMDLHSKIILTTDITNVTIIDDEPIYHRCYTGPDCTGFSFPMESASACCIKTDNGMSYSEDEECILTECIVHGFAKSSYTVTEGEILRTLLDINIKGSTSLSQEDILRGRIDTIPINTDVDDFEPLSLELVPGENMEISLVTIDDEITLEYNDTILLEFEHENYETLETIMQNNEFLREKVVVHIIDNDLLQIGFEKTLYSIDEEEQPHVKLLFTMAQNPFSITFYANTSGTDGATAGKDFTELEFTDVIYRDTTEYKVSPLNFSVIDDFIVEFEEKFDVVAELGEDVPDSFACFQSNRCERNGATQIKILDNDMAKVGLDSTSYVVLLSEGVVEICANIFTPNIECPIEFPFEIRLLSSETKAVTVMDNMVFQFSECVNTPAPRCITMPIVEDAITTRSEVFNISLELTSDLDHKINLRPKEANITIINTNLRIVGLEKTLYEVSEDVGEVEVCANVTAPELECPLNFPFTVTLYSVDNTAVCYVVDADYVPVGAHLSFEACQLQSCVNITIIDDTIVEHDEDFMISLKGNQQLNVNITPAKGRVRIFDDDTVMVRLTLDPDTVDEGSDVCACANVDSTLNCPVSYEFKVAISTQNLTAVDSHDYDALRTNLTFTACQDIMCKCISITEDQRVEAAEEQFVVKLESLAPNITTTDEKAVATIIDRDEITYGMQSIYREIFENETNIEVCVEQKPPYSNANCPVDFPFSFTISVHDNTATSNSDFKSNSTDVLFQRCATTAQCIKIYIIDDNTVEHWEIFYVSLEKPPGLTQRILLRDAEMFVTIMDIDKAEFGFSEPLIFYENTSELVNMCIEAKIPISGCPSAILFELIWSTSDGTAIAEEDYNSSSGVLSFQACEREQCLHIAIIDDKILEESKTFSISVTLFSGPSDRISLEQTEGTITIIDNDSASVEFERTHYEVEECPYVEVCAVVSKPQANTCTIKFAFEINFVTIDHSAVSPFDYTHLSTTLRFEACQSRACVSISTVDDCHVEENEEFEVELRRTANLDSRIRLSTESAFVHIIDNDYLIMSLEQSVMSVREDEGAVELCTINIIDQCHATFPFNIRLRTLDIGSATLNEDYEPVSSGIMFNLNGGLSQRRSCVNITITDDMQVEQDEIFCVSLEETPGLHENILIHSSFVDRGDIVILNDDKAIIGFQPTSVTATEEAESVDIELCVVVLSPDINHPISFPFEVEVTTTDGTAVSDQDYISLQDVLRFDVGELQKCFSVEIVHFDQVEAEESFTVSLLAPITNSIMLDQDSDTVKVSINDSDVAMVGFVQTTYTANEYDGTVSVCAEVKNDADIECLVNFAFNITFSTTSGGTADPTLDYEAHTNINVSFDPCEERKCFGVGLMNDCLVEDTETFVILLATPSNLDGVQTVSRTAVISITDNDTATVGFEKTSYEVDEDEGKVHVCVGVERPTDSNCSCVIPFDISITITSTSNGLADDYIPVSENLRRKACEPRVCMNVSIVNDMEVETSESFDLSLTMGPSHLAERISLFPDKLHIIIKDDDTPVIRLQQTAYTVNEGEPQKVCAVVQAHPSVDVHCSTFSFTVTLHSSDGTADGGEGEDYLHVADELTCERLCTTVTTLDDIAYEAEETFTVALTNTNDDTRINVDPQSSTITIKDRDSEKIKLGARQYTVTEGEDEWVRVCVGLFGEVPTRSHHRCRIETPISFNVSTKNVSTGSSAVAGSDYSIAPNATLTIDKCARYGCIYITIVDDPIVEEMEKFRVSLTNITDLSRITFRRRTTRVLINDIDEAYISINKTLIEVHEGVGEVEICVVIINAGNCPFEFNVTLYKEGNTTADEPRDYTFVQDEVAFHDCETSCFVSLLIVDDTETEFDESLFIGLEVEGSDRVVPFTSPSTQILIIDDDDAVVGLERTSYQLNSGTNSVEVCANVSDSTHSDTPCPIPLPFNIIFHLSNPSPEYFEVDVTQSPRPKGGIVREGDEVQDDVILNFNSCQRKMCFDVSLKDGSSRPPLGHYDITLLVVRAPNHSIITALDQERASGFIEIR